MTENPHGKLPPAAVFVAPLDEAPPVHQHQGSNGVKKPSDDPSNPHPDEDTTVVDGVSMTRIQSRQPQV